MVLDTETIGVNKPFVYDIGFIVAELKNGKYEPIYDEQLLVSEIYDNLPLFATAYYSEKRPLYEILLEKGLTEKQKLKNIMFYIKRVLEKYEIEHVFAYNSSFDKRAINFTTKFFKVDNPLENVEWPDIQKIANIIHRTTEYIDFAAKMVLLAKVVIFKQVLNEHTLSILEMPNMLNHIWPYKIVRLS